MTRAHGVREGEEAATPLAPVALREVLDAGLARMRAPGAGDDHVHVRDRSPLWRDDRADIILIRPQGHDPLERA